MTEVLRGFLVISGILIFSAMLVVARYYIKERDWRFWLASGYGTVQWIVIRRNYDDFHVDPGYYACIGFLQAICGLIAVVYIVKQIARGDLKIGTERGSE